MLNHRLHFNIVISKFPISTSLTTDFLYMTKSSDRWQVVCIEIENQHKKIFTNNRRSIHFSSEFNNAYDQVLSWRAYITEHIREVKDSLNKLFRPLKMANNPLEFKYLLVLGRNSEKLTQEHINMFNQKNTHDINVMTFDSIINHQAHEPFPRPRTILSKNGTGFKIKYINNNEVQLFAYLKYAELEITQEQNQFLINLGYDMEAWYNGESLAINNRIPLSKKREYLDSL